MRRLPRRARVPRGRDPGPPAALRRRGGAPVRDPPQRARHAAVPADRRRALPQAAAGGRLRAGLRDRPRLPERGDGPDAQSRVHHARVLPGLRRLPRHDAAGRGARDRGVVEHCAGHAPTRAPRHDPRFHAAVPAGAVHRGHPGARGARPPDRERRRDAGAAPRAGAATATSWRSLSGGRLQDEVFKAVLEPDLVQPTFVLDYPSRSRRWPRSTGPTRR